MAALASMCSAELVRMWDGGAEELVLADRTLTSTLPRQRYEFPFQRYDASA